MKKIFILFFFLIKNECVFNDFALLYKTLKLIKEYNYNIYSRNDNNNENIKNKLFDIFSNNFYKEKLELSNDKNKNSQFILNFYKTKAIEVYKKTNKKLDDFIKNEENFSLNNLPKTKIIYLNLFESEKNLNSIYPNLEDKNLNENKAVFYEKISLLLKKIFLYSKQKNIYEN